MGLSVPALTFEPSASLGIAEFSRDPDEPVKLATFGDRIVAVTERGAVAITTHEKLRPFASESITSKAGAIGYLSACLKAFAL